MGALIYGTVVVIGVGILVAFRKDIKSYFRARKDRKKAYESWRYTDF